MSGSVESMFLNPAGLAWLDRPEATMAYGSLLQTSYLGSLGAAFPYRSGTWALGVQYFSQSSLEAFNSVGDSVGSFRPFDYSASADYALRFGGSWSAGFGTKLVHSDLAGDSGSSIAFDAGLLGRGVAMVGEGPVDVGVYFRNLGPPLKLGSQADPLPFEAGAGFSWEAKPFLRVLADVRAPVDADPYVTAGIEAHREISDGFEGALRVGYSLNNGRGIDGLAGLTAGAGISLRGWRFDYAWSAFGDLGSTNRASLSFLFGEPRGKEAPAPAPDAVALAKPLISVLRIEAKGLDEPLARAAGDFMLEAFEEGGSFRIVSRDETDRRLLAAGLPETCSDAACASAEGRTVGVQRAAFGSLSYVGGEYYLEVRVVDAADGRLLFSGTESFRKSLALRDAAQALARRAAQAR